MNTQFQFLQIQEDVQVKDEAKQSVRTALPSVLCDQFGNFTSGGVNVSSAVPNRNGYSYHRLFGYLPAEVIKNETVPPVTGTVVVVGYTDGSTEIEVLKQNNVFVSYLDNPPTSKKHAYEHEPGGADPLAVYRSMLLPLRLTTKSAHIVSISSYEYDDTSGARQVYDGVSNLDLSSYVPATGQHYLLVYLDSTTNTLSFLVGTNSAYLPTRPPAFPDTPAGGIAIAYVKQYAGQTELGEGDIEDARRLFVPAKFFETISNQFLDQLGALENQFDAWLTTHLVNG